MSGFLALVGQINVFGVLPVDDLLSAELLWETHVAERSDCVGAHIVTDVSKTIDTPKEEHLDTR